MLNKAKFSNHKREKPLVATIVEGNPVKVIRNRFDYETICRLLETEWWSLENKEFEKLARGINFSDRF